MPRPHLWILIALAAGAPSVHAAPMRFASMAGVASIGAYCTVDENSQALGFNAQSAANYVAGLLGEGGVTVDAEAGLTLHLNIYSVNLKAIGDPSMSLNTHALTITVECSRVTEHGQLIVWRDLLYGGYSGVTAQYIIDEIQLHVTNLIKTFVVDYHKDNAAAAPSVSVRNTQRG